MALRKATSCLHVLTPLDLLSQLLVDTKKFGLEWLVLIMHFLFSIFCLYIWEIASVFRVSIFSKGQKLKKAFCLFLRSCLSNLLSISLEQYREKAIFEWWLQKMFIANQYFYWGGRASCKKCLTFFQWLMLPSKQRT